jgi:hypothetical protein
VSKPSFAPYTIFVLILGPSARRFPPYIHTQPFSNIPCKQSQYHPIPIPSVFRRAVLRASSCCSGRSPFGIYRCNASGAAPSFQLRYLSLCRHLMYIYDGQTRHHSLVFYLISTRYTRHGLWTHPSLPAYLWFTTLLSSTYLRTDMKKLRRVHC